MCSLYNPRPEIPMARQYQVCALSICLSTFGSAGARSEDDAARSIQTIVPHELECVEEDDEDQMVRQE